jgi:endonuclease G
MHPTRRRAWWVAWNVDGLTLYPSDSISRSGERFKLDPRVPAGQQTGEGVYADNDLDRGHVARRSDLLWGATLEEALRANSDSFFFTNITPQRAGFNQSGRGGVWGLLENAVLALDGLAERRLSVFAGPVLADADPTYRNLVQLPREFWKVVIYRVDDELRLKAFLLTQNLDGIEALAPDDPEDQFLDDFDTYLVGLDVLEDRTGLMFSGLRDVASPAGLRPLSPRLVRSVNDIDW